MQVEKNASIYRQRYEATICHTHSDLKDFCRKRNLCFRSVEPRYNESLHNDNLGITNDFLQPSNSKIYETEPDITKPRYSEQILPVPRPFVICRFHVGPLKRF